MWLLALLHDHPARLLLLQFCVHEVVKDTLVFAKLFLGTQGPRGKIGSCTSNLRRTNSDCTFSTIWKGCRDSPITSLQCACQCQSYRVQRPQMSSFFDNCSVLQWLSNSSTALKVTCSLQRLSLCQVVKVLWTGKNEHVLCSLLICGGFSLTGIAMNAYPLRDPTCLWLAYYSCLS